MPAVDSKMCGRQSVNSLRISVISYHNKFSYPNKAIGIFLRSLLHRVEPYTMLWNFFRFFLKHHRTKESRRKNLPFAPYTFQLYRLKDRYFIDISLWLFTGIGIVELQALQEILQLVPKDIIANLFYITIFWMLRFNCSWI